MRRVLLLVLLAVGLSVVLMDSPSHYAKACGGEFPPVLEWESQEATFVLAGEVVSADTLQMNGVIQVEEYFGENIGPQYISAQQTIHSLVRANRTGALHCYVFGKRLNAGDKVVMFSDRLEDGIYGGKIALVFPDTSTSREVNFEGEFVFLTYNEILEALNDIARQEPSKPLEAIEPLPAPILIHTSTDAAYLLPVDAQPPLFLSEDVQEVQASGTYTALFKSDGIKLTYNNLRAFQVVDFEDAYCFTPGCLFLSANGLYIAYKQSANDIVVCSTNPVFDVFCEGQNTLEGQAFVMSDVGERLAVWNNDTLTIYQRIAEEPFNRHLVHVEFTSVQISPSEQDTGVWSNDEYTLAYSDNEGLWLWQSIESGTQPMLFVPSHDNIIPTPRYFSASGRYVAVKDGEELYTIDLISKRKLPDGIVSPDERLLAVLGDERVSICTLMYRDCPAGDPRYSGMRDVAWMANNTLMVNSCNPQCSLFEFMPYGYGVLSIAEIWVDYYNYRRVDQNRIEVSDLGFPWWDGTNLLYHPIGDYIALQNNETTISVAYGVDDPVRVFEAQQFTTLDLSDEIDGEIVSIEWLPSYFYEDTFRRYVR